ncbi:alpha-beta hydrolase superfamily lysophospholipase [Nocardioides albertanoniae]|uniref:Alpha-beta hydrolase superfamily lysophospholipase n=1 Tax=Nocardioides albertanoniae TaxID=1175486 RepID=A0A543A603_9ACTN|nr:alpha/beta fold hydrolase [Nocardioides albertanoniae]TQL68031.1 alpha-beta hydrolase superfamily lysophospholipase [Nocardioides albertanoniae]
MALTELDFPSRNGRDHIKAWIYAPATTPRGIIHLVHGLGEHSRRYLRLIARMLDAGFVVCADDHVGHGATAMASGFWADSGENGLTAVVEDEATLRERTLEAYPGLPYFLYGHSWGSMIARAYAGRHPHHIDGLVLGGIAAQWRGPDALSVSDIEAAIGDTDGAGVADEFMSTLFDGVVERYDDVRSATDWVAADRGVVADHAVDPLNRFGVPMTLRFLRDFVAVYDEANADDWASKMPDDLPVLILAGDQDPVANYGEGAYHVANQLWSSGNRAVRTRVYTGYRHEVHNEPPIRDEVAAEIIGFVEGHID